MAVQTQPTVTITGHQMRGWSFVTYTDYPIVIRENTDGTWTVSTETETHIATDITLDRTTFPDPPAHSYVRFEGNWRYGFHGAYIDADDFVALDSFLSHHDG